MEKREKVSFYIVYFVAAVSIFLFLSSLWIRKTYGVLMFAAANTEFLNLFENKRRLFAVEVCVPAACISGFLLVGGKQFIKKVSIKKRKYLMILGVMLSLVLFVLGGCRLNVGNYVQRQLQLSKVQWYDENKVVIHALGIVDGFTYTNSKEALENNYLEGNKVFECDMILTSDQELVACHDWNTGMQKGVSEENIPTKEEFMQKKIYDKYSPMSIDEIIEFMAEDQDVYIITDTKYAESEYYEQQFEKMINSAVEHKCEDVLNRFVIQIYHPYMYGDIEEIHHFDNYIYTLYQEGYRGNIQEFEEYAKFCVLNGIDVITMNEEYYSDELLEICNRYGLQLFVHTVNDKVKQKEFLEKNIGIYTDKKL